jgi:hypothetical protein
MSIFNEYLSQLDHPILNASRLDILSMEAALEEVDAPIEVIVELREGIFDGIASALGDDFYGFDLRMNQVARSINSLKLKE